MRADRAGTERRFEHFLTVLDNVGHNVLDGYPRGLELSGAERLRDICPSLADRLLHHLFLGDYYHATLGGAALEHFQEVGFYIEVMKISVCFERSGETLFAGKAAGIIIPGFTTDAKFFRLAAERTLNILHEAGFGSAGDKRADIGLPLNSVNFDFAILAH